MNNKLLIELIFSFREGDMTVFPLIYEEFKGLIIFYGRKSEYEDTVQELTSYLLELLYGINIRIFKRDGSDGLKRYIAVSLRNKYISLSMEYQKYKLFSEKLYDKDAFIYDGNDERLCAEEGLNALSKRQRIIMVYKYIYNYSDSEISKMLGISRQAVNRLKNRGLNTLRQFYNIKL